MAVQTQIDPASSGAQSTLDGLFGTLNKGLELWGQWTATKTANVQDKANISGSVTPTMGGDKVAGLSVKAWIVIGAVASVVLGLVVFLRRR